jgi:hypothetical protein
LAGIAQPFKKGVGFANFGKQKKLLATGHQPFLTGNVVASDVNWVYHYFSGVR